MSELYGGKYNLLLLPTRGARWSIVHSLRICELTRTGPGAFFLMRCLDSQITPQRSQAITNWT